MKEEYLDLIRALKRFVNDTIRSDFPQPKMGQILSYTANVEVRIKLLGLEEEIILSFSDGDLLKMDH